MATELDLRCRYCGRTDFRSPQGYSRHLQESPCNAAWLEDMRGAPAHGQPPSLRRADLIDSQAMPPNLPSPPQKPTADFRAFHDLAPVDFDHVTFELGGALDEEEGMEVEESEEEDDYDEKDHGLGYSDEESTTESDPEPEEEPEEEEPQPPGLPPHIEALHANSEGPITWIREQFKDYCRETTDHHLPLDKNERSSIHLMNLLKDKKAPLNAYKDLMEWHIREKGDIMECQSLKEAPAYINRKAMLRKLTQRYNFANKFPYKKKVKLPVSGTVVHQTLHYAPAVMQQLLTDPRLKDAECLFYDDDPLGSPPNHHTKIGDIHTGKAFRATYRKLEIDPEKREQLMPIVVYIDGSAVSHFHDMELVQLKVSLGFWSRTTRTKEYAWGILGYIEKENKGGGRGREIVEEANHMEHQDAHVVEDGDSYCESLDGIGEDGKQDFHAQVASILEGLKELIERGFLWDLVYKDVIYRDIHYKPFIPFVKCDTKEADTLCGKYQMRRGNVKQICRYCHVPLAKANDHNHKCVPKTEAEVRKLIDKGDIEGLKAISQSYLKNAFHGLRFNRGNGRGIHGACPSDMLHAFLLGIFKCIRTCFFEAIGGGPAKQINALSAEYSKLFKRQSDKSMPPCKGFTKGIQDGKLMGKEYRGVLLLMNVMVHSQAGRKILKTSRKGQFKTDAQIDEWGLLIEHLLQWDAYLNSAEMKVRHVFKLGPKNRYIMHLIRKVAKRKKKGNQGWKLMKFHSILHLMEDILLYGVPLEFDTSANESHHKPSKQAAKLTQQAHVTFNVQTATRLTEFKLIELALLELEEELKVWEYYHGVEEEFDVQNKEVGAYDVEVDHDDFGAAPCDMSFEAHDMSFEAHDSEAEEDSKGDALDVATGGTRIWVQWDANKEAQWRLGGRSKFRETSTWHNEVIEFLCDLQEALKEAVDLPELEVYTYHKRGDQIFRGHPNYMGKGHWRDWVWVQFDKEYCCQIWCFVVIPNMEGKRVKFGGIPLEEGVFGVVETTERIGKVEGVRESELLVPIKKDLVVDEEGNVKKQLCLADTRAFVAPVCVVPDLGGPPNQYFALETRSAWAEFFIEWLDQEKEDDTIPPMPSDKEEDFATDESESEGVEGAESEAEA